MGIVRILLLVAFCVVAAYSGDLLSLRYNFPKRPPFGTVMVRQMYAIKLKNKQTEYSSQPPEPQECVNSLFAHYGDPPCWYLQRNTRQRIDVDSGQPQIFGR